MIEAVVGKVAATGDADVASTVKPLLIGLVIIAEVAISFYYIVIVYYPAANDGVLHVACVVETTLISKQSVLVPK